MSDKEKKVSGSKNILVSIPALITAIAALIAAIKSDSKNELMLHSLFNYSTQEISKLNEKHDELKDLMYEIKLQMNTAAPMMPVSAADEPDAIRAFMGECQSDSDCPVMHECQDSQCVAEESSHDKKLVTITKPTPTSTMFKSGEKPQVTFKEIQQHVLDEGKPWQQTK